MDRQPALSRGIVLALVVLTMVMVLVIGCERKTSQTLEVSVPDLIRTQLQKGVPDGRFAFYALAGTRSITCAQLNSQVLLVICDNYPPLADKVKSALGSFSPGTLATFKKGTAAADLDIEVPVGSSLNARLKWAVEDELPKHPGLVLLT